MKRVLIALICAVLALTATGCGSGSGGSVSREEYGTQLRATMTDLESAYGDVGASLKPSATPTPEATQAAITRLRTSQVALRDAGNRLHEIEPPEALAADHRALVRGVRDMADAIDLLIEAQDMAGTDPARAAQLARQFASDPSFRAVQKAAAKIEKAGVNAGL